MGLEILPPKMVNRLYMVKQGLVRRAQKSRLGRVVEDICGLHAQVPTTPYFSLWNRVEDFQNTMLDRALYEDKILVKVWCMRGTLHTIPSKDLPIYHKALKKMWFEHHGRFMRAPEWPSAEERRTLVYPQIVEALAQSPLTRKELSDKVRSSLNGRSLPYDRLFSGWGGILKETGYEGMTVHAEPRGRESCFARLDRWLPEVNLDSVDEEEAQEKLLLKYLRGYGPATQQDFALWSGLIADDAKRAIENASSLLDEVGVEGVQGRFLLLKEDRETLESTDFDEKPPPRLLPRYDSILLGHRDRSRIIQDEHRQKVFKPKVGDVAATLLVNGRIAGTWRQKRTKKTLTITIKPFAKISREELAQAENEAKALSQFMELAELRFQVAS